MVVPITLVEALTMNHDIARCPECSAALTNQVRRELTLNERHAEAQRVERSMGSLQFYGNAALTIAPRAKTMHVLGECFRHGLVRTTV
jgi:ribosomal protein L34E